MIQDARDLIEHDADVLGAQRRRHLQQLLHGQHVAVLVAHHGDVIQPVHITDALVIGLALGELLGAAVQQADMRIGAFDHLAVQLQHQSQHAVGGRMLRSEVHGVVLDLRHGSPS